MLYQAVCSYRLVRLTKRWSVGHAEDHTAITQFAAWIGAVVSTYQPEDKIWFNVLHSGEMQIDRVGRLVLVGQGAVGRGGIFRHGFAALGACARGAPSGIAV